MKKRRKSKAARATQAKKAAQARGAGSSQRDQAPGKDLPEAVEFKRREGSRGGLLTGMRGGFKAVAGAATNKKKNPWIDALLWIAVILAAIYVFYKRF